MELGSRFSLSAAFEAAEQRQEYADFDAIEANLDRLRSEARSLARQMLAARIDEMGGNAELSRPSRDQVEQLANGILLGVVAPGEQRALSALLFGKGA